MLPYSLAPPGSVSFLQSFHCVCNDRYLWFLFTFPNDEWCWTFFHVPIFHSYIIGKSPAQIFCPLIFLGLFTSWFLTFCIQVLCIYVVWKSFFLVCVLSLHYPKFLSHSKIKKKFKVMFINFFFLWLCLWCYI